ncbi:uncharacterized protein LOC121389329 [Gigantopelta aegis]|uniref:uncharacterized protein LOC121389329 n=1 Tax=Gigantopelta aegis TaxID=1735272 RepID=UPI001B88B564|nr:uncharacterized protein LOC121389329 [Gigantopelta aegis]
MSSKDKYSCESLVLRTTDGMTIFVTINCVNKVQLTSYSTIGPLLVIWSPPSLEKTKIALLSGNNVVATQEVNFCLTEFQLIDGFEMFQYRLARNDITSQWYNTSHSYATIHWPHMEDGKTYEIQVQARNSRQLVSNPISTEFLFDSRLPQLTGHEAKLYVSSDMVHLDWKDVFITHQLKHSYTVSIGSREGYTDVISHLTTDDSHFDFPSVDITKTTGYHVTVKVTLENEASVVYSKFVKMN